MKSYLMYKDKSIKEFKKILTSGGGVYDKYRPMAASFIRYASSTLDTNLAEYSNKGIDLESIELETVFPTKYKWLFSNLAFKQSRDFMHTLEGRMDEFKGKEDNLKICVGIYFIKLVLITKMVETYLSSVSSLNDMGVKSDVSARDIGITNSVLVHFNDMHDMTEKTIDEWLNYKSDPVTAKYFYSSMKRVLTILLGSDNI